MAKVLKFSLFVIFVSALFPHAVCGKVVRQEADVYWITGEITNSDVSRVRTVAQNAGPATRMFFKLDSPGGDIHAAIELGRIIRKTRATCVVPDGAQCSSACVLVLAGAVDRLVWGRVGIHRPYSTYVGKRDVKNAEAEYRKTASAVGGFLKDMNLPQTLFEAMVRVPSEQIRSLTNEELVSFGLAGTDPVEEELRDSWFASLYGISKSEYFSRKAAVDEACPPLRISKSKAHRNDRSAEGPPLDITELTACRQAFMYGIPVTVYKSRLERAQNLCSSHKNASDEWAICAGPLLRGEK
jgi:ATP-dependent protease ClpP protease subunit